MGTKRTVPVSQPPALWLGVLFLASGAVALVYQAAWQRQFTLLFGSAAPATAAVLAAYFAGLGLGSWLLGKWRARHPLRTYALLEVLIAAGALLVAPVLSLYESFYPWLYAGGQSGAMLLAAKGLLAFAAVVIPAAAMGGTLPVLAQLFESRRDRLGDMAGRLYMLNTAGAAIGVLLFPTLLGAMGMRQSVWLCAGVNLLLAAGAWLLAKSATALPAPTVEAKPAAPGLRLWLGLAFVSGFVTFVLQTGWNRIFAQTHGNSVHSFSLITAIFIAAIAAGAQLARVLLRRGWTPERGLLLWGFGGFVTVAVAMLFPRMTDGLKYVGDATWFPVSFIRPALMAILLPVTVLATGLPFILQKAASLSQRPTGHVTGSVLAWNVAGCVAGALVAGFVFPLVLGMFATVALAGTLAMLSPAFLNRSARWPCIGLAAFGVAMVCLLAFPLTSLVVLQETSKEDKILALKEDAYGITAVVESPGSRRLKLNNHYALGGSASVGDERMQAHLPLLLHPQPKRVAFLGYGTGITAGGSFYHEPEQVAALELVPAVVTLAGEYFAEENNRFATQPWARLVTEDARNFLRGTREEFDLIVGDLVVPWRQGEGALYTLEHFQAARARLAPGGLYCAWLPLFQLGEADFQSILRTFLEVWPEATVWRGDFSPTEPALALMGYANGALIPEIAVARIARMKPDPANAPLRFPRVFWLHFIGRAQTAAGVPLNTADRPRIELHRKRPTPFSGRALQAWEKQIAAQPLSLQPDAAAGREAGMLMREWTLLFTEGRQAEAQAVLEKVVALLGPEAAREMFGN